jgi:hypothetical protein
VALNKDMIMLHTTDILVEDLTTITQIGFVVKNLDHAIEKMKDILGVTPVISFTPLKNRTYFGEKSEFIAKLGFYRFANIELEFIEPVIGPSEWERFLNNGNEGLHHIRFSVKSISEIAKKMKAKGIDISMQGASIREGLEWAYFDSLEKLGFIIEIFDEFKDLTSV